MSSNKLTLANAVLLGPMSGVNDPIFRSICKRYGADLTYSEMISAAGLAYKNAKTSDLLYHDPSDSPFCLQLFGKDPGQIAHQAAELELLYGEALALIDLNMACPARKVVSKGEGAALMQNPQLAETIIKDVVENVSLPVTVKIRRGYLEGEETAVEFARMAEAAGASAVAVHGRWAVQLYTGQADKSLIGRVKSAVLIPVIASGDVFGVSDVVSYFDGQGADAVMVARGAQGRPWVFAQVKAALTGSAKEPAEASLPERLSIAKEHTLRLAEVFPHRLAMMKKHIAWYFKGTAQASAIRSKVNLCSGLSDYLALFEQIAAGEL
ncbi:MAG: tRNA dihydrouridine synthase DusB [Coriobacteriia bacterium]|nr:tRNA dihydrouridine synthase DusB [Coriobacteriia bacterium]